MKKPWEIKPDYVRVGMETLKSLIGKHADFDPDEVLEAVLGERWFETEEECLTGKKIPHSESQKQDGKRVSYVLKRYSHICQEHGETSDWEGTNRTAKKIAKKFLAEHRGLVVGTKIGIL